MWIKICGITHVDDAIAVAESGASAIGLNFFEGSRRFVSADQAATIISAVRAMTPDTPLDIVGVFVNSAIPEVAQIARQLTLTAVQFHGDESLASIAEFRRFMPKTRIIRAIRVSLERSELCLVELDRIQNEVGLSGCLLDAYVSGEFGGTGTKVDLRIAEQYLATPRPRLILAGGLTPENVGDVILKAKPWGVDTASGVESSPGRKQPEKIAAFVASALQAASRQRTKALSSIPLTPAGSARL
jgi:phosphoribosylanthranilate isomerase